jgi:hypothetical protein
LKGIQKVSGLVLAVPTVQAFFVHFLLAPASTTSRQKLFVGYIVEAEFAGTFLDFSCGYPSFYLEANSVKVANPLVVEGQGFVTGSAAEYVRAVL